MLTKRLEFGEVEVLVGGWKVIGTDSRLNNASTRNPALSFYTPPHLPLPQAMLCRDHLPRTPLGLCGRIANVLTCPIRKLRSAGFVSLNKCWQYTDPAEFISPES
ncbi:hypothetical protein C2E23DRAFT_530272 [Lenzites betulinus]|nr:hypothetical protein C2E23DRAFT_530272 [Lenzites betulinus]